MEQTTRKVVGRSPARTVRLINLPHLQSTSIEAESSLERDFVHMAALFPLTKKITHQPFKMTLEEGRHYTPDFLVDFHDGSHLVVEVKPESKQYKFLHLFDQVRENLARRNVRFIVANDRVLRNEDREARALRIRRYGKSACPPGQAQRALDVLSRAPKGLLIGDLRAEGIALTTALHLIARQRICIGSSLHFEDSDTVISSEFLKMEEEHAIHFDCWSDASAR